MAGRKVNGQIVTKGYAVSRVLTRRPQEGLLNQGIINSHCAEQGWTPPYPEFNEACRNHNAACEVLKKKCRVPFVYLIPESRDIDAISVDSLFPSDAVVTTQKGYIKCRDKSAVIRSEEFNAAADFAFQMGQDEVGCIQEPAVFNGGDVLMISPSTAVVAISEHSDAAGQQQMKELLTKAGVKKVVTVELDVEELKKKYPGTRSRHLTRFVRMVDPSTAVAAVDDVPAEVLVLFTRTGITVITMDAEEMVPAGCDLVAAGGTRVLVSSAAPLLQNKLTEAGFDVLSVDVSEIAKSSSRGLADMFVATEWIPEEDLVWSDEEDDSP